MLMDIANFWSGFLVGSAIIYAIALLLVGLALLLTKTQHLISGAIIALTAGFFGQASKLALKIGIFLAMFRLILNFI